MPFAETSLINGRGAARSEGSTGELIYHFGQIRLRVNGNGSLKLKIFSFQHAREKNIKDIPMAAVTDIEPSRLTNFISQRSSIELRTDTINDYMRINRIILYSKYYASEFPQ